MKDFLKAVKGKLDQADKNFFGDKSEEEKRQMMTEMAVGAATGPKANLKPVAGNAQKIIGGTHKSKLIGKFKSDPAVTGMLEAIKRRINLK